MALAGASASVPVWAQDSLADMMTRNQVLSTADPNGNTAAAAAVIATNEPILSFDTLHNLQLAIAQYEPFVARVAGKRCPSAPSS
jgi:hypothetical protein